MCDVNRKAFFCQKMFSDGINMGSFKRFFIDKTVNEDTDVLVAKSY